jgi:4'-phosphopantetheinyl transferase EntD
MLNSYWRYICTPRETAWMQSLPPDQQQPCAALIFSAKESFYKCQFTFTQTFLGFQDVVIVPDLGRKRFEVRYAADAPGGFRLPGELQGRFGFHGPYVCTGVIITRPDNPSPS